MASPVAWHLSPGTCRLAHRSITSHRHLHLIVINIESLFEYVRTLPPEHSVAIARMDFSMLTQSLRQRKERSSPISRCPDVVRPEVVRAEVLRSEVVRPEVIRPELMHREVVCPEVVNNVGAEYMSRVRLQVNQQMFYFWDEAAVGRPPPQFSNTQ